MPTTSDSTPTTSAPPQQKLQNPAEKYKKEAAAKHLRTLNNYLQRRDVPDWFRGCSEFQMKAADQLYEALRDDNQQATTYRVRAVLRALGLTPVPRNSQIRLVIQMSRCNDLAFLYFLLEMCYKTPKPKNAKPTYDENERIILTSIAHLDLVSTLRELDRVLPPAHESLKKIKAAEKQKELKRRRKQNRKKFKKLLEYENDNVERAKMAKDYPKLPYFKKLTKPKYWQHAADFKAPLHEVKLDAYEVWKNQYYTVRNESNRWYRDYALSPAKRLASSVLGEQIESVVNKLEQASLDANTIKSLCMHHKDMVEQEKILEKELKLIVIKKANEHFDTENTVTKARKYGIIKDLAETVDTYVCQFKKLAEIERHKAMAHVLKQKFVNDEFLNVHSCLKMSSSSSLAVRKNSATPRASEEPTRKSNISEDRRESKKRNSKRKSKRRSSKTQNVAQRRRSRKSSTKSEKLRKKSGCDKAKSDKSAKAKSQPNNTPNKMKRKLHLDKELLEIAYYTGTTVKRLKAGMEEADSRYSLISNGMDENKDLLNPMLIEEPQEQEDKEKNDVKKPKRKSASPRQSFKKRLSRKSRNSTRNSKSNSLSNKRARRISRVISKTNSYETSMEPSITELGESPLSSRRISANKWPGCFALQKLELKGELRIKRKKDLERRVDERIKEKKELQAKQEAELQKQREEAKEAEEAEEAKKQSVSKVKKRRSSSRRGSRRSSSRSKNLQQESVRESKNLKQQNKNVGAEKVKKRRSNSRSSSKMPLKKRSTLKKKESNISNLQNENFEEEKVESKNQLDAKNSNPPPKDNKTDCKKNIEALTNEQLEHILLSESDSEADTGCERPIVTGPLTFRSSRESEMFFKAPMTHKPYQFNYRKIFRFADPNKLDIKRSVLTALDADISVLNALYEQEEPNIEAQVQKCSNQIWSAGVAEKTKAMEEEEERMSQMPPPPYFETKYYDCDNENEMLELLQQALQLIAKDHKFVLASLPDAHKMTVLREWTRQRYGKKYSAEERQASYKTSAKVFYALNKMPFSTKIPYYKLPLGAKRQPNYICQKYIARKMKRRIQQYFRQLDMEFMRYVRVFWLASRICLCDDAPAARNTFFNYMPARSMDIMRYRLWNKEGPNN